MNLKSTATMAGKAALRAGTVAALATAGRQLRRRAHAARRAQRARTIGKSALALAALVGAGLFVRSRMA